MTPLIVTSVRLVISLTAVTVSFIHFEVVVSQTRACPSVALVITTLDKLFNE